MTGHPALPAALALDLESVLVPEIWEAVANMTGIGALSLTTRDLPDYDALMGQRIRLCRQHGLTLPRLRQMVDSLSPLPGALEFLHWAQSCAHTMIVSDTFHELAGPRSAKLNHPRIVCHQLETNADGHINGYRLHHPERKRQAVAALKSEGYRVAAVGDSFNDLAMLEVADTGILFRPSVAVVAQLTGVTTVWEFAELKAVLTAWLPAQVAGAVPHTTA